MSVNTNGLIKMNFGTRRKCTKELHLWMKFLSKWEVVDEGEKIKRKNRWKYRDWKKRDLKRKQQQ